MTLASADEQGVSLLAGERGADGAVRMTAVQRVLPWDEVLQVALVEIERLDRFFWEERGYWQLTFLDRSTGEIPRRSARRTHLLEHLAQLPGFERERAERMLRVRDYALVWQRSDVPCPRCGHRYVRAVPEAAPVFWDRVHHCTRCGSMSTLGRRSVWGLGDDRVASVFAEGMSLEAPARDLAWSSVVLVTLTHIPRAERPMFADAGHFKLFAADGRRAHVPLERAAKLRLLDHLTVLPGFERAQALAALEPGRAGATSGAPITLWQRDDVTCPSCGKAQLALAPQSGPLRWERLLACPRCDASLALGASSEAARDGE